MTCLLTSPEIDAPALSRVLKERGLTVTTDASPPPGEAENSVLLVSRSSDQVANLLTQAGGRGTGVRYVACCSRPTARERRGLLGLGIDELIEPPGWSPQQIAVRLLSATLPAVAERRCFHSLHGASVAMCRVYREIEQLAPLSDPVLIVGETGTGKELVSKALHAAGRAGRPWVAQNIAAANADLISSDLFGHEPGSFTGASRRRQGLLSKAGNGTVLLDEIGDLDAGSQVKLLRVIEDRTFRSVGADREARVEARFVLATHKDLETLVEQGAFRRDLFERIRGFAITLPPLRERQEDLPMLAEHFLREFEAESGGRRSLPSTAVDLLFRYAWPGNVRELRGVIRKAAAFSNTPTGPVHHGMIREATKRKTSIAAAGVMSFDPATETWATVSRRLQQSYFEQVLELSGRNVSIAAKAAGLSRSRFYEILKNLEIPT